MTVLASFRDGSLHRNSQVRVSLKPFGLAITKPVYARFIPTSPETELQFWPYASLYATSYHRGGGLTLGCSQADTARLYISDGVFCADLAQRAPQLMNHAVPRRFIKAWPFLMGGTALLAASIYVTLNFLPSLLQPIVPAAWTKNMSAQFEKSLIADSRRCNTPEGEAAFSKIISHLAEGNADLPAVQISVYDLEFENAFAIAGGKIIVTRGLLENASSPDEIAGILAHEFGHAYYKHPETSLIRVMGTEMLLSSVTATGGKGSGVTMSSLAAVLHYSREYEMAADTYANNMLVAARIDPQGAKHFFERALKREERLIGQSGVLSELAQIYSTHPRTEGRVKQFGPLPEGMTPVTIMNDGDWQALKEICGKSSDNASQEDSGEDD